MEKTATMRKPTHAKQVRTHGHSPEECREIGREEKIFIFSSTDVPDHATPGKWMVASPLKPVMPGQTVVWQVVSKGTRRLELKLSDVFEEPRKVNETTFSARVRDGAQAGLHFYEARVDGQVAIGGSSPGIIIDPGH